MIILTILSNFMKPLKFQFNIQNNIFQLKKEIENLTQLPIESQILIAEIQDNTNLDND